MLITHRSDHGGLRQVIVLAVFLLMAGHAPGAVAIKVGQNIQGATLGADSGLVPPDADGAVGPNHYVQLVNGSFKVFSKTNGALVQSKSDISFWTNAGIPLNGLTVSDPRVFYDPSVQRWFASQIDVDENTIAGNDFLIAVSATTDPTGVWKAVSFPADTNGNFADFPTLGLDANGVYIAGNMFQPFPGGGFLGVEIVSLPKSDLLLASPTATNRSYSGLLGGFTWGFALQPTANFYSSNSVETVVAVTSDGTDFQPHNTLSTFVISNAASSNAVFAGLANLIVPNYNVPINPTQPGGINSLDDGDARINASVYQAGNFIYAVHATQVGPRAAIRWYKLDAASRTLLESGTISDTNLEFFYPSIAANSNGLVVIGFNGCSTNTLVSSFAAVGETVNGSTTFGSPVLLRTGGGTYQVIAGPANRWGDYSATSLDPANVNTFWTIQEIPSSQDVWSVQITQILIEPVLGLGITNGNAVVSWDTNSAGFTLLSNTNLVTTNWTVVTPSPTVLGNQFVVTNSVSSNRFYRLVQ